MHPSTTTRVRIISLLTAAALGIGLVALPKTTQAYGAQCNRPSDCAGNQVCGPAATCMEACLTDKDCGAGQHCARVPSNTTQTKCELNNTTPMVAFGTVFGYVVDQNGAPVRCEVSFTTINLHASCNEDGYFVLPTVGPAAAHRMEISAPGKTSRRVSVPVVANAVSGVGTIELKANLVVAPAKGPASQLNAPPKP